MALERERKYLDVDLDALQARLEALGAEGGEPYFESNVVFDRADGALKSADVLLRLRRKPGRNVLTVKRPPDTSPSESMKVYEEIETEVSDHDAMVAMLDVLGFVPAFAYEKVRAKWRFMGCVVCCDHLPFGDFVEIEGEESAVDRCAVILELDRSSTSLENYHQLNLRHREKNGLPTEDGFVFDDATKAELLGRLEKIGNPPSTAG